MSNVLALSDLELNVADKFLKTPLHYACECGAITSALYMIQRGAKIDQKDIFGNTPLGVALINNQWIWENTRSPHPFLKSLNTKYHLPGQL